ncbi:hypothetical protein BBG47_01590 [Paenibacillus sp. KS1]|uniref:hypothetical protein n=1 Tax=Paenibacillus sp. KS1 TaxID=1849249 RepID=UPI00080651F6|nr:hypothetical protein [Paenibacillus sp. KS1]OBY81256.1 hypothetical protein BBG47_01590 [Paenibacillus sp. KS1]
MYTRCICDHYMDITVRTVVHARTIHIHRVPVVTCVSCGRSELLTFVKKDVAALIHSRMNMIAENPLALGEAPLHVSFDEQNELASVIVSLLDEEESDDMLSRLECRIAERVNQLLDLYLFARTCNDTLWMDELQCRLKQISGFSFESYRVKIS